MIRLGQKVRDVVSGFEGIVVCRTEWLNGCVRYTVQPRKNKDGTLPDCQTFDAQQLKITKAEPIELPQATTDLPSEPGMYRRVSYTGGERPDPPKRVDPR